MEIHQLSLLISLTSVWLTGKKKKFRKKFETYFVLKPGRLCSVCGYFMLLLCHYSICNYSMKKSEKDQYRFVVFLRFYKEKTQASK
jgi:hypothetical protein